MYIIIRYKLRTDLQDIGFCPFCFGQGTFEQFVDAVAYEIAVSIGVVGRIAVMLQGVVGGGSQVGDGIQQRTIQIEYHKLLHKILFL